MDVRKGAWSSHEDSLLINYIALHGEGRWNYLARNSGLRRTGKSCRLRWKNYLCPNVRLGNFTPQEQLAILKLHACYGNRWSKIAQCLPGRTDNEIKNYWRTRVQKQAKQLKCDINSTEFKDFIRDTWIPTLSQQIQQSTDYFDDNVIIDYNGPGQLETDFWASFNLSPDQVQAHNNVFANCSSRAFTPQVLDSNAAFDFQGIHSPARLSTPELLHMLPVSDDYFFF